MITKIKRSRNLYMLYQCQLKLKGCLLYAYRYDCPNRTKTQKSCTFMATKTRKRCTL